MLQIFSRFDILRSFEHFCMEDVAIVAYIAQCVLVQVIDSSIGV